MNIIDGISSFMARKNLNNKQVAELLGCSDSTVSLYLSGKSGISLEKLGMLLKNGMTLEEAFGTETAAAIKKNIGRENDGEDPMGIVLSGLKAIISAVENGEPLANR